MKSFYLFMPSFVNKVFKHLLFLYLIPKRSDNPHAQQNIKKGMPVCDTPLASRVSILGYFSAPDDRIAKTWCGASG